MTLDELMALPATGIKIEGYKNPSRLVVRSDDWRPNWRVLYVTMDGFGAWRFSDLGKLEDDGTADPDTALTYSWRGGGNAASRGVNGRLADKLAVTDGVVHEADTFYLFLVSPDYTLRSLVFPCVNDKYVPLSGDVGPPWELTDKGTPEKASPSKFAKKGVDNPFKEPDVPEPTSLLPTVKEVRAKYGTPLQNEEMGMLLNEVAWIHREDGWGCAEKPTGKHTNQPTTGIRMSRDLLYHKPTEKLFDVLADVEGEARPVWNEVENDGKLPWLAPVIPEGTPDPPDPPGDLEQRVALLEDWARNIGYDG